MRSFYKNFLLIITKNASKTNSKEALQKPNNKKWILNIFEIIVFNG